MPHIPTTLFSPTPIRSFLWPPDNFTISRRTSTLQTHWVFPDFMYPLHPLPEISFPLFLFGKQFFILHVLLKQQLYRRLPCFLFTSTSPENPLPIPHGWTSHSSVFSCSLYLPFVNYAYKAVSTYLSSLQELRTLVSYPPVLRNMGHPLCTGIQLMLNHQMPLLKLIFGKQIECSWKVVIPYIPKPGQSLVPHTCWALNVCWKFVWIFCVFRVYCWSCLWRQLSHCSHWPHCSLNPG